MSYWLRVRKIGHYSRQRHVQSLDRDFKTMVDKVVQSLQERNLSDQKNFNLVLSPLTLSNFHRLL